MSGARTPAILHIRDDEPPTNGLLNGILLLARGNFCDF